MRCLAHQLAAPGVWKERVGLEPHSAGFESRLVHLGLCDLGLILVFWSRSACVVKWE